MVELFVDAGVSFEAQGEPFITLAQLQTVLADADQTKLAANFDALDINKDSQLSLSEFLENRAFWEDSSNDLRNSLIAYYAKQVAN